MTPTPNTAARLVRRLPALLAGLVIVLGSVGLAAGAGGTTVSLTPDERTIEKSNTTTFDIVVADAAGGVGAYAVHVELDDPAVGTITNATVPDSSGLVDVNVSEDGSAVSIETALLDTADTGSVTVASVIVEGDDAGQSGVSLTVDALGDEDGNSYDVTDVEDASLQVTSGQNDGDGSSDTGGSSASDQGAADDESSTGEPDATDSSTSQADSTPEESGPTAASTTDADEATTAPGSESGTTTPGEVSTAGGPFGFDLLVWAILGLGSALAAAGLVVRRR
jgi:hypothetical protein